LDGSDSESESVEDAVDVAQAGRFTGTCLSMPR
jgi:hypothetical protein